MRHTAVGSGLRFGPFRTAGATGATRALRNVIQWSDFTARGLSCQTQRTYRFAVGGLSRMLWYMHQQKRLSSGYGFIGSSTAIDLRVRSASLLQ